EAVLVAAQGRGVSPREPPAVTRAALEIVAQAVPFAPVVRRDAVEQVLQRLLLGLRELHVHAEILSRAAPRRREDFSELLGAHAREPGVDDVGDLEPGRFPRERRRGPVRARGAGEKQRRRERGPHSGCRSMSFTSLVQRTRSSLRNCASCSGVPGPSLIAPSSSRRFWMSSFASTAFTSAFTLRTMGSGVPVGATSANHPTYSNPG